MCVWVNILDFLLHPLHKTGVGKSTGLISLALTSSVDPSSSAVSLTRLVAAVEFGI